MKTTFKIEECEQPFCVIHTSEVTPSLQSIAYKIISLDENGRSLLFRGWDGDFCKMIKPEEVYRIFSLDKKVFIQTQKETFQLKIRLYEAEEFLSKNCLNSFIRISNTDIVNFNNADHLDLSLTGTIKIIMKNETSIVVSRRYMGTIRKELCLKK